jgi:hypothetical protein
VAKGRRGQRGQHLVTPRDSHPELGDHVLPPPDTRRSCSRAFFILHFSPSSHILYRPFRPLPPAPPICPGSSSSAASVETPRFERQKAKRNTSRMHHSSYSHKLSQYNPPCHSYTVATTNFPPPPPNSDGSTSVTRTRK